MMEETICLNFEINLKRLSLVHSAAALWENPAIKKEMERHGSEICNVETDSDHEINDKWWEITQKIFKFVASLYLPQTLESELKDIVILTGRKIFLWFHHVIDRELFSVKYLTNFYLKCNGTVDENKIYEVLRQDPNFPGCSREKEKRLLFIYVKACANADLKFIGQSLKEIAELVWFFTGIKIKNFKVQTAMTIILLFYISKADGSKFIKLYTDLKNSVYPNGEDKMFAMCGRIGLKEAAEYFYQKLNKIDLPWILDKAAKVCLESRTSKTRSNHEMEQISEMLLYILMKMSNKQRKEFLIKNITYVYTSIVNDWPSQTLCVKIIDYVWNELQLFDQIKMLHLTLAALKKYSKNHRDLYNKMYLPVLENMLMRLPKGLKVKFFRKINFVYHFIEISNFSCLNRILNDPDLIKNKSEFLTDINQYMLKSYLLLGGHSNNIKDYLTAFKFSDEQKRKIIKFCLDPALVTNMLYDARFDVASDVLEWQCFLNNAAVVERKIKMLDEDSFLSICTNFIKEENTDKLEMYLKWQLNNDEEEIERVKAEVYSESFICKIFWKECMDHFGNLNLSKDRISCLLKCCLKTVNDITRFKENLAKNDALFIYVLFDFQIPVYTMKIHKIVSQMNEVLDILTFSTDQVNKIKQKVKKEFNGWLNLFPDKFVALDKLVTWITYTEEEKEAIIKSCLNSSGAKLCFELCHLEEKTGITHEFISKTRELFLFKWVKLYGNVEKLRYEIMKLNGCSKNTGNEIFLINSLLDKLVI